MPPALQHGIKIVTNGGGQSHGCCAHPAQTCIRPKLSGICVRRRAGRRSHRHHARTSQIAVDRGWCTVGIAVTAHGVNECLSWPGCCGAGFCRRRRAVHHRARSVLSCLAPFLSGEKPRGLSWSCAPHDANCDASVTEEATAPPGGLERIGFDVIGCEGSCSSCSRQTRSAASCSLKPHIHLIRPLIPRWSCSSRLFK